MFCFGPAGLMNVCRISLSWQVTLGEGYLLTVPPSPAKEAGDSFLSFRPKYFLWHYILEHHLSVFCL